MTTERKEAPASACRFAGGEVNFAASTDDGKTVPIRMMARSADPIEHYWWGRVVHDMAGMKLHKKRIPVDYEHGDPIGYLDKFDPTNEGLFVEGALVRSGQPGDRVPELLALSGGGVPYESSINFFGDGIKLEWLGDDQVAQVNGKTFEGPGVIIREWPLRGVAVCPYGADMYTESKFSGADQTISLTTIKELAMSKEASKLSGAASAETITEQKPAATTTETTPAAQTTTEQKPAEERPAAETTVETTPAAAATLSDVRAEAKRFRKDFGDKGAVWFSEGLTHEEARERQTKELRESSEQLAKENTELKKKLNLAQGEQEPVSFEAPGSEKKKGGFASKIKIK